MSEKSEIRNIYSLVYRRLHWSLAAIIVMLLVAGQQFNLNLSDAHRIYGLKAHSSLGTLSLIIALFFVIKRFILRRPTPKPHLPLLKLIMARSVQLGLYMVAVLIPVSGVVCALCSLNPVYLFGLFDLSSLQPSGEATFLYYRSIHVWATRMGMLLLACHAGAALYHHFIVKDDVLKSMAVPDPLVSRVFNSVGLRRKKPGGGC